jgi:two-component system response regulator GlrR
MTEVVGTNGQDVSGIRSVTPARVLIVDDDQDSAELFQYLLLQQGLDVSIASSVETALDAAKVQAFDIVMSDVNLPDGDGCALFAELRKDGRIRGIAITGFSGEDSKRRCAEAGFRHTFVKPADVQRILDTVRALVDEVRAEAT